MLILILCGVIFVILFWYVAIRPMSYWTKRGVKQGTPVWLFGDNLGTVLRRENFSELAIRVYSRFPNYRYSGMYQFTIPTLVIQDPELLKQITVKDFDHFVDHRTFIPENADPLLGKNLFALKGQRWREMRPILSPSFTSSKMRQMFILMSECADVFVNHFLAKNQDIVELEMKDVFTRYGNDAIASVAFGIKVDSLANPNNQFYRMGKEATDFSGIGRSLKFFGYMLMPKIFEIFNIKFLGGQVTRFFQDLINETIRIREEQKIARRDMIHLLLEARKGNTSTKHEENDTVDTGFATVEEAYFGKADATSKAKDISNLDIAAHSMIFFFGGFDTITTLMCFMAYELALHPEIQNRLRQEIKETKRQCRGNLTYEALMKMNYMDMVISESLRKWPNVGVIDRVCTKPYTIRPENPNEKPLIIETGTVLMIPVMGIHRDPKYYPNPDKFDPERFNDENKYRIAPYTYLPFGLGPRNCLGSRYALLQIKTVFFQLLSNFEIVPTKKTTIPIKLTKRFQMAIEGGFNLGLKRLTKN